MNNSVLLSTTCHQMHDLHRIVRLGEGNIVNSEHKYGRVQ